MKNELDPHRTPRAQSPSGETSHEDELPGEVREPRSGFSALRPLSRASSLLGRGKASTIKTLHSKLHEAFAKRANRGVLEAAISVERIQRLRGTKF